MIVKLTPQLESAITKDAQSRGIPPEKLALDVLNDRFLVETPSVEPQDEWERQLFDAAIDCGVSVTNSALSREGLYD